MTPFDHLRNLYLENDRLKYPSFPEHCRIKPKYSDATEKGLIKCIVDFLNFNGHLAERVDNKGHLVDNRIVYENVIGQMKTIGSKVWHRSTHLNGTADISATVNGRSWAIEIKIGKDTQSDMQKRYQTRLEAAGGVYLIAKDFAGFYEEYKRRVG